MAAVTLAAVEIHTGSRVVIHPGTAEPEVLVLALIDRAAELSDVEVVHLLTLGNADYVRDDMAPHFRHRAFFVGGCVRNALLGEPVSDVDISTDAVPDEVMRLTAEAGLRPVPTGLRGLPVPRR